MLQVEGGNALGAGRTVLSEAELQRALNRAWACYLVLLACPFVVFLSLILYLSRDPNPVLAGEAQTWFVIEMVWMGVAVPASFFVRSRLFKAYWMGGVVTPRNYLAGMLVVWIALETCGLLSLLVCFLTHTLIPNILPALLAFMLFTPFWPSGQAMVSAVGGEDDSEVFRHPR